jgi:signal recognition particle receptor subunit beta
MAVFNLKDREIDSKIVFYGPARSGKTTNFRFIAQAFKKQIIGRIVSIKTDCDRTLFFDFLPMELGQIEDFKVRIRLYTIPGQVRYRSTRKLILRGADGIVFVADSLEVRREENKLSLKDLKQNLREIGGDISKIPLVIQCNKRDIEEQKVPLMTMRQIEEDLNSDLNAPTIQASAAKGEGVAETLRKCLKLVYPFLKDQLVSLQKEDHRSGMTHSQP